MVTIHEAKQSDIKRLLELSLMWEKEDSCYGYRANTEDDLRDRYILAAYDDELIAYIFGKEEISLDWPCAGSHTSTSQVLAEPKPISPVHRVITRNGNSNKRNNQKKFRMEQSRRPKKNPLKAEGIEKVDLRTPGSSPR